MTIPWGIDWTRIPTPCRVGALVRVEVSVDGTPRVYRWCGPISVTGSGLRAQDWIDPPEAVATWEGRIGDVTIDRSLGPLRNHVQTLSGLSFDVALDGEGADAELLRAALVGRWGDRRVDVALVELSEIGVVVGQVPRFRGTLDRGPAVGVDRLAFRAVQGIAPIERPWPMTRIPDSVSAWTHDDTAILSGAPGSHGGVLHGFHPDTYGVSAIHKGKYLGPVFGRQTTAPTQTWREIVYYGSQETPDTGAGDLHLFFFVSPQFDCYVHSLYWDDPDHDALRGADDDPATLPHVRSLNNHDPQAGPVGTVARLSYVASGLRSDFLSEPFPRAVARVSGPAYGAPLPGDVGYDGGRFDLLREGGGALRSIDSHVIEDIFCSSELLDLGLPTEVFRTGSLLDFTTSAPVGLLALNNYRFLTCAVPRLITEAPPETRAVLGDLLGWLGADLIDAWDPLARRMALWPRRRRPSPPYPDADHVVHGFDLLTGDRAALRDWRMEDDPDAQYGNEVRVRGPDYQLQSYQVAAGDDQDLLQPTDYDVRTHVDLPELSAHGRAIVRDVSFAFWRPFSANGFIDGAEFVGAASSQPIRVATARLGARWFALELGDTLRYEVDGLRDLGVGQVRRIVERLSSLSVEVTTYHLTFFGDAEPRPPNDHGKQGD